MLAFLLLALFFEPFYGKIRNGFCYNDTKVHTEYYPNGIGWCEFEKKFFCWGFIADSNKQFANFGCAPPDTTLYPTVCQENGKDGYRSEKFKVGKQLGLLLCCRGEFCNTGEKLHGAVD